MVKEFVHETGDEIRAIGGGYSFEEIKRLDIGGREVIYALANGVFDTTCCGTGGCRYAFVPGYVVEFKSRTDERGRWVSRVEPIDDEAARIEISRALQAREIVQQVQFG